MLPRLHRPLPSAFDLVGRPIQVPHKQARRVLLPALLVPSGQQVFRNLVVGYDIALSLGMHDVDMGQSLFNCEWLVNAMLLLPRWQTNLQDLAQVGASQDLHFVRVFVVARQPLKAVDLWHLDLDQILTSIRFELTKGLPSWWSKICRSVWVRMAAWLSSGCRIMS